MLIWDSTNNYFKAEAPQNAGKWSGSGDIYYNGGDVGIGTTSPSEKLEVNGTVKATTLMYGSTNVATELSTKAPIASPSLLEQL